LALKEALPFELELVPRLADYLKEHGIGGDRKIHRVVSNVSDAGDGGGIMCHIDGLGVVSLTQVRVFRPARLAITVAGYHNRRVKKLRRQQPMGE
jgi:hypothetical protein